MKATEFIILSVYMFGVPVGTVSVRVDDELKERMTEVDINWSKYIHEAIKQRVEPEARRRMAKKLMEDLEEGEPQPPRGFINEAIKEMRESVVQEQ